ncbi:hypothetical protein Bbelb_007980 [Branchiostoma belcheri]|nr:hypothetical protein Bbelb_007980 [Branchiostoma belcheri]
MVRVLHITHSRQGRINAAGWQNPYPSSHRGREGTITGTGVDRSNLPVITAQIGATSFISYCGPQGTIREPMDWSAIHFQDHISHMDLHRTQDMALSTYEKECGKVKHTALPVDQPPAVVPCTTERRELAAVKLLKNMLEEDHPLHDLVPPARTRATGRTLRNATAITVPAARTQRLKNSFLHQAIRLYNNNPRLRRICPVAMPTGCRLVVMLYCWAGVTSTRLLPDGNRKRAVGNGALFPVTWQHCRLPQIYLPCAPDNNTFGRSARTRPLIAAVLTHRCPAHPGMKQDVIWPRVDVRAACLGEKDDGGFTVRCNRAIDPGLISRRFPVCVCPRFRGCFTCRNWSSRAAINADQTQLQQVQKLEQSDTAAAGVETGAVGQHSKQTRHSCSRCRNWSSRAAINADQTQLQQVQKLEQWGSNQRRSDTAAAGVETGAVGQQSKQTRHSCSRCRNWSSRAAINADQTQLQQVQKLEQSDTAAAGVETGAVGQHSKQTRHSCSRCRNWSSRAAINADQTQLQQVQKLEQWGSNQRRSDTAAAGVETGAVGQQSKQTRHSCSRCRNWSSRAAINADQTQLQQVQKLEQ